MPKRGKRAFIPRQAEAIIIEHALKRPREKRTPLAKMIQEEMERKGYDVPEIEVLERKISKYRNHAADDPQDKPWSIATLDTLPISPQALPIVLKEYKRHVDEGSAFTIRQAKWIARLSATQLSDSLPALVAKTEQMYELLGEPPDLEIFDRLLAGLPGQADNWHVPFMAFASLAGILKNDPTKKAIAEKRSKNSYSI